MHPCLPNSRAVLYIFHGDDTFSLQQALDEVKAGLALGSLEESNTTRLGPQTTPQELIAICSTAPFLAPARLVIAEGVLGRADGQGGGRRRGAASEGAGDWTAFLEFLPMMPESTHLALLEGKLSARNELYQQLKPHAQERSLNLPQPRDWDGWAQHWLRDQAKELGLQLDDAGVRLLVELVETTLWALDAELKKLAAYAAGGSIGRKEVQALVTPSREHSVFPVVDAIVEGQPGKALKLLSQLDLRDEGPEYPFFMLLRQYRLLVQAAALLAQGSSAEAIRQTLGVRNEFAFKKLLQQARRYTVPQLREAYERLQEADLSVKRGLAEPETALDLLVYDLAEISRLPKVAGA